MEDENNIEYKMCKEDEILLDIIPIYNNEMIPTRDNYWHIKSKIYKDMTKEQCIEMMVKELKYKFQEYDGIIIIENGMVIKILSKESL